MRSRTAVLIGISLLYLVETVLVRGVSLDLSSWLMLGLAASFIGRAVAYLAIFDWLRAPLTVVEAHSSGAGEDVEPRYYTGWRSALGEMICCPVCVGTHAALVLLMLVKVDRAWGLVMITALSASAVAWLVSWATEWVEWSKHQARETTGALKRTNLIATGNGKVHPPRIFGVAVAKPGAGLDD